MKSGLFFRSVILIVLAALLLGFIHALYMNTGFIGNWMGVLSGLDSLTITTIETGMTIAHILSLLLCGFLSLRYPCIKILRAGVLLSILGIFGMYAFPSLPGYIICYGLLFGSGTAAAGYAVMFIVVTPLLQERYVGLAAGVLCCCGNGFSTFLLPILENILQNLPSQFFS